MSHIVCTHVKLTYSDSIVRRCHWDAHFFKGSHVLLLSSGGAVLPVSIDSPWRSVPDVMVTTLYHEMEFSKKSSPILSPKIILLNCWTWTRTNWSKNEITISLKFSINAWKDGFVTAQSTAQWSAAVQNGSNNDLPRSLFFKGGRFLKTIKF